MTTHIRRHERSASDVFVPQAVATRVLGLQGSFDCDIDGALEAGQYGMAFVAVRSALHQALFIYLAREGRIGGLPTDVSNQVYELLAAHDPESEVLREAWRLERMNPMTPEEVRSFAAEFRRFAADVLRLDTMPMYGTLLSDAEYGRYLEFQEQMSSVFEHLGIQGINLPESQRRTERRSLVKSNLGTEAPSRAAAVERAGSHGATQHAPSTSEAVPVTMRITLTEDDARALATFLREDLSNLTRRMAQTDGRDERRVLLTRLAVSERLLLQVEAASASE